MKRPGGKGRGLPAFRDRGTEDGTLPLGSAREPPVLSLDLSVYRAGQAHRLVQLISFGRTHFRSSARPLRMATVPLR
jgi:hypothetical protein